MSRPIRWQDGLCENGHDVTDPQNVYVKPGGMRQCRPCRAEWGARYRHRQAAAQRARYGANPWRRHGLSVERHDEMLTAQGGGCAICGRTGEPLHVDHDHACCPGTYSCGGCVRGLLCAPCNSALARAELAGWLARAAAYLNRAADSRLSGDASPGADPADPDTPTLKDIT